MSEEKTFTVRQIKEATEFIGHDPRDFDYFIKVLDLVASLGSKEILVPANRLHEDDIGKAATFYYPNSEPIEGIITDVCLVGQTKVAVLEGKVLEMDYGTPVALGPPCICLEKGIACGNGWCHEGCEACN